MLAYLAAIETEDELRTLPNFGAHRMVGDRGGEWSLIVTKNWRMAFRVGEGGALEDMDLEDYH